MKAGPRITFDPPSDTVQAYRLAEFLNRRGPELPPPEVVRSTDNEVLLYCWDRKPRSQRDPR